MDILPVIVQQVKEAWERDNMVEAKAEVKTAKEVKERASTMQAKVAKETMEKANTMEAREKAKAKESKETAGNVENQGTGLWTAGA